MFVGHYTVGLVLKSIEKKVSLGLLFLAVQLVDIVFFPLVILGIERLNIIENFTKATHFELEYMPYTHGLLASFIWAGIIYILFRFILNKTKSIALVMSIAVLSHWFLDLIVHTPDLPLFGDSSMKLGLGLWNNAIATYLLEAALLILGLWIYLRSTNATQAIGKYGMGVLIIFMLIINAINVFGPLTSDSNIALGITSLLLYIIFAGLAFWLDGKRT